MPLELPLRVLGVKKITWLNNVSRRKQNLNLFFFDRLPEVKVKSQKLATCRSKKVISFGLQILRYKIINSTNGKLKFSYWKTLVISVSITVSAAQPRWTRNFLQSSRIFGKIRRKCWVNSKLWRLCQAAHYLVDDKNIDQKVNPPKMEGLIKHKMSNLTWTSSRPVNYSVPKIGKKASPKQVTTICSSKFFLWTSDQV